jgi:hypothetical protein
MSSIRCPLCGMHRSEPQIRIANAQYSEACCCSDTSTCVHHQFDPSDAPMRPDKSVLEQRAKHTFDAMMKEFSVLKNNIEKYNVLRDASIAKKQLIEKILCIKDEVAASLLQQLIEQKEDDTHSI